MSTKEFVDSLFEGLPPDTFPEPIEATLYLDNLAVSKGKFDLKGRFDHHATFRPANQNKHSIHPRDGANLKIEHDSQTVMLLLKDLTPCQEPSPTHVHFHFEVIQ